ncbi:MAG: amidohydrolase [Chloroflexi bacterium]|nr:amidohydrolase [Chloroflexota bacterium]
MIIVDAQIHLWEPSRPDRPWDTTKKPHLPEPLTLERCVATLDEAGVQKAVLVTPVLLGYNNDYQLEAARRYPDRFTVMGRFDATAPDASEQLDRWLDEPAMSGLRLSMHEEPWYSWIDNGTLDWFWPRAEALNVPVKVYLPGRGDLVAPIAERYPGITFFVDHMATKAEEAEPFAPLYKTLGLAKYPKVYVNVTALPVASKEPYPFKDTYEPLRRVYDAFGPQRMLWGTDYSRMRVPYRQAVDHFLEAVDFLSADDLEWIMGKTALATHRWQTK